jgi:hypothetical protein
MSEPRTLRSYQYVNRSYAAVRELLRQRPLEVFQQATASASERANAIAASLHAGKAELCFFPLTSTETQLEIEGAYRPPLGIVGNAIDAAVGHRVAEATVHRFLDDVVERIRRELPATS